MCDRLIVCSIITSLCLSTASFGHLLKMLYFCVMKKVSFHTLGCKLNFSESSTLARHFVDGGYERTSSAAESDIIVVNTCSVTDHADKKCRNLIRRLHRLNPSALIAVTGCYAQLKSEEIAGIEGVGLVVGNNGKGSLFELTERLASHRGTTEIHTCAASELTSFFASFSTGDRTRSFLKVQDGCDYRCSYCTIPLARGASRNIDIDSLVGEAQAIASSGCREIVLTGVNIGDFGRTTGERFIDLLRRLDAVKGIERYRISSIEPNLLSDDVIEFTSCSPKFMPHFHIPLQSGCDKILALMRRRYNTSMFRNKIEKIRRHVPDAFIGIDVIVGFPGETDDDFAQTYSFLDSLHPSFLHVFPYSERADTDAIHMTGKVSPEDKERRAARLGELSIRLHRNFAERFVGQKAVMLVEGTRKGGLMFGYTANYLRCEIPYEKGMIGKLIEITVEEIGDDGTVVKARR